MKQLRTLVQKEFFESMKNGKLLWLPITLILLSISQPISSYYLPQILNKAGNLPAGTVIEIPTPTGAEVMASTISQFGMIGLILCILSTMSVIVGERNNGSLSLIMARPVTPTVYILSKWLTYNLIMVGSFLISYLATWYYTNLLFSNVSFTSFLMSFLMESLWIVFVITAMILFGTLVKSAGGVSALGILNLFSFPILRAAFPKFTEWLPSVAQEEATTFLMTNKWGDSFFLALGSTLLFIIVLLLLSIYRFKRFESY